MTASPSMPWLRWVFIGLVIGASLVPCARPAKARAITDEELAALLPDKERKEKETDSDKPIRRYRWSSEVAINIAVITSGQRDPCVSAAVKQIKGQADLVRRDVPSLRLSADVQVLDQVPEKPSTATLLIALPTEDEKIVPALGRYITEARPGNKVLPRQGGLGTSHGVGREDDPPGVERVSHWANGTILALDKDYAVLGSHWAVNRRGIEYLTGRCGWYWGDYLLEALGATDFYIYSVPDWYSFYSSTRGGTEFEQRLRRAFLRVLHDRPASVDSAEVRRAFQALINDPAFQAGGTNAPR